MRSPSIFESEGRSLRGDGEGNYRSTTERKVEVFREAVEDAALDRAIALRAEDACRVEGLRIFTVRVEEETSKIRIIHDLTSEGTNRTIKKW